MQAEQSQLEAERASAERWSAAAKRQVEDVDQALADALALIDLATVPYLTANPLERRLVNLAIYLMLLVSHPDTIEAQPTAFYAQLTTLARQLAQEAAQEGRKPPHKAQSQEPRSQNERGPGSWGRGSQSMQMAERAGFEPAMEFNPHTRLAGECLQPLGHLSLDRPTSLECAA
jgi:hypothetical protein